MKALMLAQKVKAGKRRRDRRLFYEKMIRKKDCYWNSFGETAGSLGENRHPGRELEC